MTAGDVKEHQTTVKKHGKLLKGDEGVSLVHEEPLKGNREALKSDCDMLKGEGEVLMAQEIAEERNGGVKGHQGGVKCF